MSREEDENEDTIPDSDTSHFSPFAFHSSLRDGATQGDADHQEDTVVCIMQLSHLS
jgi:hypothetical protein